MQSMIEITLPSLSRFVKMAFYNKFSTNEKFIKIKIKIVKKFNFFFFFFWVTFLHSVTFGECYLYKPLCSVILIHLIELELLKFKQNKFNP